MMHNIANVFFLGFSSGLPFLLILSTLSVWLAEVGVSNTMIGAMALVSVPYSLKFIWGAVVDRCTVPWLSSKLGLRRSWILSGQVLVWIFLVALGNTDPAHNIYMTALFAFLVGCGSAIQDIAIEAYRIEILPHSKIGVGASTAVLGYRFGMLCSGAGTIFLAAYFNSWPLAYNCTAACMLLGIITTLSCSEPHKKSPPLQFIMWQNIKNIVLKLDWQIVFPFILCYKIADTVLNVMSMPFLVEIGFNNLEIASVAKTFGITAMIIGGLVGGICTTRLSLRMFLAVCVILQVFASALFVQQALIGHNLPFLFITMGVENLACGMSQVALMAYLSHLCTQHNTALQYAVLTSFASLMRVSFSSIAGWMADQFAWSQFYAIVCVSCVPSLILLMLAAKHFNQVGRELAPDMA